jgi:hypothetical protein
MVLVMKHNLNLETIFISLLIMFERTNNSRTTKSMLQNARPDALQLLNATSMVHKFIHYHHHKMEI